MIPTMPDTVSIHRNSDLDPRLPVVRNEGTAQVAMFVWRACVHKICGVPSDGGAAAVYWPFTVKPWVTFTRAQGRHAPQTNVWGDLNRDAMSVMAGDTFGVENLQDDEEAKAGAVLA